MFQILAPLNLKELWYLVVLVLSSGGRLQEVKNNAKTIKPSGQNWSQWLMRGRRLPEVVIIGF